MDKAFIQVDHSHKTPNQSSLYFNICPSSLAVLFIKAAANQPPPPIIKLQRCMYVEEYLYVFLFSNNTLKVKFWISSFLYWLISIEDRKVWFFFFFLTIFCMAQPWSLALRKRLFKKGLSSFHWQIRFLEPIASSNSEQNPMIF